MCRDPNVQKYSQKEIHKRKRFSVLDLDLLKYKIGHICCFLQDKDILKLRLIHRSF